MKLQVATRKTALLGVILLLAGYSLGGETSPAYPQSGGVKAKGYLNLRYAYIGSASKDTVYQGLRLTGTFELSALGGKISFKYRSHHWITFRHTDRSVLESPFENRNIFQTAYLEARDLIVRGVRLRAGRMVPESDYASLMPIDGGWLSWDSGSFNLTASAGRTIDYWSGKADRSQLQTAVSVRYQTDDLRASLGFNTGEYFGLKKTELPVGLYARLGQNVWLDAYGSYDFKAQTLARAGLSLSWRVNRTTLSVRATQWRNPFDELYLADKNRSAIYWADYSVLPVTYRDIRLSFATSGRGFGFRASGGWMGGVRSGWLGSGSVIFPALWGMRLTLGGQAMKGDFIEFYSADASVERQFGALTLQVLSQTRYYQWRPRPSDFHNTDNYTELSVEYPLQRHFYLSLAGGGYFRQLGDESFKPQVEFRFIYRL